MLPKVHFIVAVIVSVILALLGWQWWQLALFFIASFFIDVDHYIWFIYNKGSWSLVRAYIHFRNLSKQRRKSKKQKQRAHLLIFHTIEAFIVVVVLSLILFRIFFPILLGMIIHYALDFIDGIVYREKKYKRTFSLICYLKCKKISRQQHKRF